MERLLDINDLSEMLGVTKATIYSWTHKNAIPHIKLSRRLLKFREREIMEWVEGKAAGQPSPISKQQSVPPVQRPELMNDYIDDIIESSKREILTRGR